MKQNKTIVVVGAGHAGVEAAKIASKTGCKVSLVTMDKKSVGRMSCNPAIGGVAKGQIVREIDVLGGLMAKQQMSLVYSLKYSTNQKVGLFGPQERK